MRARHGRAADLAAGGDAPNTLAGVVGVGLALHDVMQDLLPSSATRALQRWTFDLIAGLASVPAVSRRGRSNSVDGLGCVAYEPSCVVADDPGEIVRHASPLDGRARAQLREQQIARLRRDPAAVAARERRIAIERAPAGRVLRAMFTTARAR